MRATTADGVDVAFSDFFVEGESDAAIAARIEAKTADCMASRGFEYPLGAFASSTNDGGSSASESGYGAVGSLVASARPDEDPGPNTLEAYRKTLSGEELAAFDSALRGQPEEEGLVENVGTSGAPFGTSVAPTNPSSPGANDASRGCFDIAQQEVESSINRLNPLYAELVDNYFETVRTDERIIESTAEWSRCVEDRTSLVELTGAPMELTRSNIDLVVFVDVANRLGLNSRWITMSEAEQLDISQLDDPIISVDLDTEVGYLVSGPRTGASSAAVAAATEREGDIKRADTECWQSTDGPARTAEIQADVMEQVALLSSEG